MKEKDEMYWKLIDLRNIIESGSENWPALTALELYFFGQITSTCGCKAGVVRSRLNQYWELQGKKTLGEYES